MALAPIVFKSLPTRSSQHSNKIRGDLVEVISQDLWSERGWGSQEGSPEKAVLGRSALVHWAAVRSVLAGMELCEELGMHWWVRQMPVLSELTASGREQTGKRVAGDISVLFTWGGGRCPRQGDIWASLAPIENWSTRKRSSIPGMRNHTYEDSKRMAGCRTKLKCKF